MNDALYAELFSNDSQFTQDKERKAIIRSLFRTQIFNPSICPHLQLLNRGKQCHGKDISFDYLLQAKNDLTVGQLITSYQRTISDFITLIMEPKVYNPNMQLKKGGILVFSILRNPRKAEDLIQMIKEYLFPKKLGQVPIYVFYFFDTWNPAYLWPEEMKQLRDTLGKNNIELAACFDTPVTFLVKHFFPEGEASLDLLVTKAFPPMVGSEPIHNSSIKTVNAEKGLIMNINQIAFHKRKVVKN